MRLGIKRLRARGPALVRLGLAGLCVAAAAWPRPDAGAPQVLVLLAGAGVTPASVESAWVSLAQSLDGDAGVTLVRFGADAAVEWRHRPARELNVMPPARERIDARGRRAGAALEESLALLAPGRPAAVVIATDVVSDPAALDRAVASLAEAEIPVHAASLAPIPPPPGLRRVDMPATVRADQAVPVAAWPATGEPAELSVHVDGVLASRRAVRGAAEPVVFELPPLPPGPHDVELRIDAGSVASSTFRMVNAAGLAPALYVGERADMFASALESAGRGLVAVEPPGVAARLADLDRFGAIVLDDVSLSDLDGAAWRGIYNAVHDAGVGLVVLGGERSFAAGGYRHSALEALLPLVSEPGRPAEPTAVLFALDLSGSMGRAIAGRRRLDLALDGLANAMRLLGPDDVTGVLGFDVAPRWLKPLERSDSRGGPMILPEASGGTRLVPALRAAADALGNVDASRRLLVLITDGYADDAAAAAAAARELPAGVEILALAVGTEADSAGLEAIVGARQGRVIAVGAVLELPGAIHREVAATRAVVHRTRATARPEPGSALPPPAVEGWPAVSGYAVTRSRQTARVHVSSDQGDPLAASWRPGAGRVFALPAGTGPWATGWTAAAGWPALARALIDAVALDQPVEGAWLDAGMVESDLVFRLWTTPVVDGAADALPGRLRRPDGRVAEAVLRPEGPGLHALTIESPIPGPWQLAVPLVRGTARHAIHVSGEPLDRSFEAGARPITAWLDEGQVRRLDGSSPLAYSAASGMPTTRAWLVVSAVAAWLLLLWAELRRGWPAARIVAAPSRHHAPSVTTRKAA